LASGARASEARREELFLIVLGGGNRLRRVERMASGGAEHCPLDSREILAAVLRQDGSALALVHTHPSGSPSPSAEDVTATRSVAAGARQVGLHLVDHIILAGARWTSLAELGYVDGSG
jgi:DNA repair protein RadC